MNEKKERKEGREGKKEEGEGSKEGGQGKRRMFTTIDNCAGLCGVLADSSRIHGGREGLVPGEGRRGGKTAGGRRVRENAHPVYIKRCQFSKLLKFVALCTQS